MDAEKKEFKGVRGVSGVQGGVVSRAYRLRHAKRSTVRSRIEKADTISALSLNSFFPVLQREVFKHFDEDSRLREDKIIHNKVAKAAKTDHCRSLAESVLSSWPLCPCCEISVFFGCGSAALCSFAAIVFL
jgi:hypothetical protein